GTGTGPGTRVVWTGPEQAMVLGTALKPISGAALSDQTSAWACCALSGGDAAAVLGRLVPIDLREDVFAVGHGARTLLGHMNCVLLRTGPQRYEIMVFRSMAATATHELGRAMGMVAARKAALGP
ncbi:MAG: sarcosine oxidase subunit gamma, partial [Roseicyclus sp.]|nr:sarcosine oxidase subunit gamma [Roseicyclus sp.]